MVAARPGLRTPGARGPEWSTAARRCATRARRAFVDANTALCRRLGTGGADSCASRTAVWGAGPDRDVVNSRARAAGHAAPLTARRLLVLIHRPAATRDALQRAGLATSVDAHGANCEPRV